MADTLTEKQQEEQEIASDQEQQQELTKRGDLIELGDKIIVQTNNAINQGEKAVGGEGFVYYRSPSLIKYLKGDTVIEIGLDDEGRIKEEHGVTGYKFEKHPRRDSEQKLSELELTENDSFLKLFEYTQGDRVQVFYKDGRAGPVYEILAVDYDNDIATFTQLDETGEPFDRQIKVNFEYTGIPIGLQDFDYNLIKKIKPQSTNADEEYKEDAAAPPAQEDAPPNSIPIPQPTRKRALVQVPENEIVYDADDQREVMIDNLINLESSERQKKDFVLTNIYRFVNLLLEMRDEIVAYSATGVPEENPKSTSVELLSDLVDSPLVRPVIDSIKNIYVDTDETGTQKNAIDVKKLATVITGSIDYIKELETREDNQTSWNIQWEGYVNLYMRSWVPNPKDTKDPKAFTRDSDFFRQCSPAVDMVEFEEYDTIDTEVKGKDVCERSILGFRRDLPRFKKGNAKNELLSTESLTSILMSMGRGLATQLGRPTTQEIMPILNAESVGIHHHILFPYNVAKYIGPTRSGKIVTDMVRSQAEPKPMHRIIADNKNHGIVLTPTTGNIIALKEECCENIEIHHYLKQLPLWNIKGFDDFEDVFNSFGINKFELTIQQLNVVKELIKNSLVIHKASLRSLIAESNSTNMNTFDKFPFDTTATLVEFLTNGIGEDSIKKLPPIPTKYQQIDFVRLHSILQQYQDLVDALLGENPNSIAREMSRSQRDILQFRVRMRTLEEIKKAAAGMKPQPNRCEHVKKLEKIRRIRDTSERMKLLYHFVEKYKDEADKNFKKTKQHICKLRGCGKQLLCDHEYKLIQEYFSPNDYRVIHKKILLYFMGGQFQGQFICRYCGQTIQELDYTMAMDESKNTTLIDATGAEIDPSFGVDEDVDFNITTNEKDYAKFKNKKINLIGIRDAITGQGILNKIYGTAKQIYEKLGVNLSNTSPIYKDVIENVNGYILKLPTLKEYTSSTGKDPCAGGLGKAGESRKPAYYGFYLNRRIILYTAAFIFIDIQTHIPDYTILSDDKANSFEGYPFIDDEKNIEGIKYLASSLSVLINDTEPWSLTQWHLIGNLSKRSDYIQDCLLALFGEMKRTPTILAMIQAKKLAIESKTGVAFGVVEEQIPSYFLPEQIKGGDKVASAKSGSVGASALIRSIHAKALETKIYSKSSPFSETTCCLTDIQTPNYWDTTFGAQTTSIPLGPRGARLAFPYVPREPESIVLDVKALYPRVFLKVCFTGANIGHPHEPGLTRICSHCNFEFPEEPSDENLPDPPIKPKDYDKWIARRDEKIRTTNENAIKDAVGDIDTKKFQDLLDVTHIHYRVQLRKRKRPTIPENRRAFFSNLKDLKLYPEWEQEIINVYEEIKKLPEHPGNELSEKQRDILSPLEGKGNKHDSFRDEIKKKLGEERLAIFDKMCELSSIELMTQLQTYFIVPFNRALKKEPDDKMTTLLTDYEPLSVDHKAKIVTTILQPHLNYFIGSKNPKEKKFHELFENEELKEYATRFVTQLQGICRVLSESHLSAIGFTNDDVRIVLNRHMILAAVTNYVKYTGNNLKESLAVITRCINKYTSESLKYSDEHVREVIAARGEAEKQHILGNLAELDQDRRRVEMLKKKLGLSGIAGTNLVYTYNPAQYDLEEKRREAQRIRERSRNDGAATIAEGDEEPSSNEVLEEGDDPGRDTFEENETGHENDEEDD